MEGIPEHVTVYSDVVLDAVAMLDAIGTVVYELGWTKFSESVERMGDDLRRSAFGFPAENDHPVLARVERLAAVHVPALESQGPEQVLAEMKKLEEATEALGDSLTSKPRNLNPPAGPPF